MAVVRIERPTFANAVVAFAVTIFLLAPLAIVIPMSFSAASSFEFPPVHYSLRHYHTYFTSPDWLGPTFNSILVGVAAAILTLVVATPAAFAVNRREFRGRRVLQVMLLMPMLVPSIIMAISYYTIFGKIGLNQTYTGVILAHACIAIPVVLITMSASLRNLDRNLERAATICGATPMQVFCRITLPILRPSFVVAGFFAFITSFDEATISLFISGRNVAMLPRRMFASIQLEADPVVAVVSSLIIGVALVAMVSVTLVRHRRAAMARR
jgi:putative spermidine/putrescine transport system permease protein